MRNWLARVEPAVPLLRPAVSSPARRAMSYWVQPVSSARATVARVQRRATERHYLVREAATRTRTGDPIFTRDVLYQLSYGGGALRKIARRKLRGSLPTPLLA